MNKPKLSLLAGYALLVIVVILTYLPATTQATIYRDDWYYTVDRLKGGPDTFHEMFEIDRPARGYLFEAYYQLFGLNPAPYHWAGFALRLLAGLLAFWLFRLLWPEHLEAALIMSLLFVLYPGYTRWLEGFENQPNIFSLCLQVLSIALTLKAIEADRLSGKIILWALSILAGLGYILLIDYAIGMEAFRFLCVFIFVSRHQPESSWQKRTAASFRAWMPALLIPGLFLFWRILIFDNQRPATDIGLQLSTIVKSPIRGGLTWALNLFRSTINQAVLAWWSPNFQGYFGQDNREIYIGLIFAVLASALTAGYMLWSRGQNERDEHFHDAIWIGLLGVIAGLLPIIAANRLVMFGAFSHYAMPTSLAAAVLAGGVVYLISSRLVRAGLIAILVLLAVMTHASASAGILNEEQVIANFWHQVAWRAADIREGTTLFVSYPTVIYGEDPDAVRGPANFIYYPEADTLPVTYPIDSVSQYAWTSKEILSGTKYDTDYRTHIGVVDPGNLLVMSQPTKAACVHIINANYPWYSYNDPDSILVTGAYSKIDNVLTDADAPFVDPAVFGLEPARKWCFYFEKAELALQNEDWNAILDLAKDVETQNLHPNERLEWMPFLQAYAVSGDEGRFQDTMAKITSVEASPTITSSYVPKYNAYNRRQACSVLKSMQVAGQEFSPGMQEVITATACRQ